MPKIFRAPHNQQRYVKKTAERVLQNNTEHSERYHLVEILSKSTVKSIIIMLPKPGKDNIRVKFCRPTSLLPFLSKMFDNAIK